MFMKKTKMCNDSIDKIFFVSASEFHTQFILRYRCQRNSTPKVGKYPYKPNIKIYLYKTLSEASAWWSDIKQL